VAHERFALEQLRLYCAKQHTIPAAALSGGSRPIALFAARRYRGNALLRVDGSVLLGPASPGSAARDHRISCRIVQDALEGEPFGTNAFVLIAVYWFVASQQRHIGGRPFLVLWLVFAAVGLIAESLRWLLVSTLTATLIAPWSVTFEYLMTVALYPVLTVAFVLAQRTLPRGGGDFMD
jgi:hypothetical protein